MPTSTTSEQLTLPRTPEKTSKLAPGNLLRWLASTRRSRGNSSPPNTPRVDPRCRSEAAQVIHLTDSSESDDEVQLVACIPAAKRSQAAKRPYSSPEGPPRRPAKKAKARAFSPAGFQLKGAKIVFSKSREHGSSFLIQWVAKPHLTTWLREEDVVAHFPQACREYLESLASTSPKRLAHLARSAGSIMDLLE